MKNRFNRCCCPGEQEHIYYTKSISGQVLFDYIIPNLHRVLLGETATIDSIDTGLWDGQGAFFGISNATIPRGSIIRSAIIKFTVPADSGEDDFELRIYGDKALHVSPVANSFDLQEANKTTAAVIWNQDGVVWERDRDIETPDISAVIQEIVNSANWNSGQNLFILMRKNDVTGFGRSISFFRSELRIAY